MKAAVLHAFDQKLTAMEFVRYEDVTGPKITRPADVKLPYIMGRFHQTGRLRFASR